MKRKNFSFLVHLNYSHYLYLSSLLLTNLKRSSCLKSFISKIYPPGNSLIAVLKSSIKWILYVTGDSKFSRRRKDFGYKQFDSNHVWTKDLVPVFWESLSANFLFLFSLSENIIFKWSKKKLAGFPVPSLNFAPIVRFLRKCYVMGKSQSLLVFSWFVPTSITLVNVNCFWWKNVSVQCWLIVSVNVLTNVYILVLFLLLTFSEIWLIPFQSTMSSNVYHFITLTIGKIG